jgi:hypothetical protein
MKLQVSIAIVIAGLISAVIWALSLSIAGHEEPWDASSYYYVAALIFGGFLSGLLVPQPLWAHFVGSLIGQLVWLLLFIKGGPLFVVGIGFLLMYSLLFLCGASLGSRIRFRFSVGE